MHGDTGREGTLVDLLRGLPAVGRIYSGSIVVLLIAAISVLDLATGWELSVAIFYFIPVSIAAWNLNRAWGMLAALTCALAWFAADVADHPTYAHPAIAAWNALARFVVFAAASSLLATLKRNLHREVALARTDRLTGSANAFAFYEAARLEVSRSARYGRPLSLAYLDIDDFKQVNDRFGHPAGDALLVEFTAAIRSRIRTTDLLARLGGDEFAILFPETGQDGARMIVGQLRAAFQNVACESGRPVGVSIGVLTCTAGIGSLEELIARADALMYRAKADHKDCTRFEVSEPTETPTVEPVPLIPSDLTQRETTRDRVVS